MNVIDLTSDPARLANILAAPWTQPGEDCVIVTGKLPSGRNVYSRIARHIVETATSAPRPAPATITRKEAPAMPTAPAPTAITEETLADGFVAGGLNRTEALRRARELLAGIRVPALSGAPAPITQPAASAVRDRESLWGEIQRAAFAARQPGQTDPECIDAFLMTKSGNALYQAYRVAPAPGATPYSGGSGALYDRHRAAALAGRKDGESEGAALSRWYAANPGEYLRYRATVLSGRG